MRRQAWMEKKKPFSIFPPPAWFLCPRFLVGAEVDMEGAEIDPHSGLEGSQ